MDTWMVSRLILGLPVGSDTLFVVLGSTRFLFFVTHFPLVTFLSMLLLFFFLSKMEFQTGVESLGTTKRGGGVPPGVLPMGKKIHLVRNGRKQVKRNFKIAFYLHLEQSQILESNSFQSQRSQASPPLLLVPRLLLSV